MTYRKDVYSFFPEVFDNACNLVYNRFLITKFKNFFFFLKVFGAFGEAYAKVTSCYVGGTFIQDGAKFFKPVIAVACPLHESEFCTNVKSTDPNSGEKIDAYACFDRSCVSGSFEKITTICCSTNLCNQNSSHIESIRVAYSTQLYSSSSSIASISKIVFLISCLIVEILKA